MTHTALLSNDHWLLRGFAGSGYSVQFSATAAGKPQGSVMVLDVSSLWKKHPTQPSISTADAGECQRRCSKLPGMITLLWVVKQQGPRGGMGPGPTATFGPTYEQALLDELFFWHSASGWACSACSGAGAFEPV
jgi:hypothetical protein